MIDLTDILFAQRSVPRGDELLPHVADLTSCLRATAYRRRGYKPEPFTKTKLAQFAIGRGYEYEVERTLTEAGHVVQADLEVEYLGLVGHPDLFVDGEMLIETKTTDGGALYPKSHKLAGQQKEVSVHHAIQASAYALALKAEFAVVLVKYAYGHEEVAHPVNPDEYRDQIEMLAREVIALTGPEMPLPPAEPKPREVVPYDQCSYCDWRACVRNPNHDPDLIEEAIPS